MEIRLRRKFKNKKNVLTPVFIVWMSSLFDGCSIVYGNSILVSWESFRYYVTLPFDIAGHVVAILNKLGTWIYSWNLDGHKMDGFYSMQFFFQHFAHFLSNKIFVVFLSEIWFLVFEFGINIKCSVFRFRYGLSM